MNERFETFTVLINRISRNVRKIKNMEMAAYELRSSHISCLYYLYTSPGLTATDLCERCEEDKATISRSLDNLEQKGFLTSKTQATKRYKSPLLLTEKGMEAGEKIACKISRVLKEINDILSEQERISFYHSLSAISEGLETIAEHCENPDSFSD